MKWLLYALTDKETTVSIDPFWGFIAEASVQLSDNDDSVLCRYSSDCRDEGGMPTFIIQLLIGPLNGSLEEGWPCCYCGKDDYLKAA